MKKNKNPIPLKPNGVFYDLTAYLLVFIAILFWVIILTVKYNSFGYTDWDLAFFNQTMWSMLHGSLFSSLFNFIFLGNHSNLIAFLFLPLYAVFPNALFLIYLKIILYCLAVWPIFLIARKNLNVKWGIFFICIYFLYLPLNYGLIYEFDWESLSIFFISWVFYFYYYKKYTPFLLMSIILLTIKENMPLYVFMLSLYALTTRREKKWIWFPLILSCLWFYLSVFVVVPYFSAAKQHGYWNIYSVLHKGFVEIIKFLFSKSNVNFIFQLFSPLAFMSFLRPDLLVLGAPFFLQHMLSSQPQEHTIYFNYSFSLAPFIFISAIFGLKLLYKNNNILKILRFIITTATAIVILTSAKTFWPGFIKSVFRPQQDIVNLKRRELLNKIPKDSSVLASFIFLPRLSTRKNLYAFHDIYAKIHNKNLKEMPGLEYALIDFNDPYMVDALKYSPQIYYFVNDFFNGAYFGVVSAINDNVLFQKKHPFEFVLFNEKDYLDMDPHKTIIIDNSIRFAFNNLPKISSKNNLNNLKFYWHCAKKIEENYEMQFLVVDAEGKVQYSLAHPVCYRIKPTSIWQENKFIEENFNLLTPNLPSGNYSLMVLFFDNRAEKKAKLSSEAVPLFNDNTIANLGIFSIK